MTNILDLIEELARVETELHSRRFMAPCVPGVQLRVRVDGLIYAFRPNPPGWVGWGIFQPIDAKRAQLVARPEPEMVQRYLQRMPLVRVHLIRKAKGKAWWAMPTSKEGFRRRFGIDGPIVVHLTKGVAAFETVRARFDGATFWFEGLDLFADPVLPEKLRVAYGLRRDVSEVKVPGLTPELVDAFVWARLWEAKQKAKTLEGSLEQALHIGGGKLETYRERGDEIVVEWRDRKGHRHSSVLRKDALQVRVAGAVCLQGQDADFDLESIVGIMSDAPDDYYYDGYDDY